MELKTLKKVFECKSIPSINRLINSSYDYDGNINDIKSSILKKECEIRYMKLCENDEEVISCILIDKSPITDQQKEMSQFLNNISLSALILDPPIKEEQEEKDQEDQEDQEWIGVDLDGTLAFYDEFEGDLIIGDPIEPMVERVKKWIDDGKNVKIMTARMSSDNKEEIERKIKEWCLEHIGQELQVTNVKDQNMEQLWDDRAVQVVRNTGKCVFNDIKNNDNKIPDDFEIRRYEISGIPEHLDEIEKLLGFIEHLGDIGSSRGVKIYVDGDGRARINVFSDSGNLKRFNANDIDFNNDDISIASLE